MKPFLPANYSLLRWALLSPALDFNKILLLPSLPTNKAIDNYAEENGLAAKKEVSNTFKVRGPQARQAVIYLDI